MPDFVSPATGGLIWWTAICVVLALLLVVAAYFANSGAVALGAVVFVIIALFTGYSGFVGEHNARATQSATHALEAQGFTVSDVNTRTEVPPSELKLPYRDRIKLAGNAMDGTVKVHRGKCTFLYGLEQLPSGQWRLVPGSGGNTSVWGPCPYDASKIDAHMGVAA